VPEAVWSLYQSAIARFGCISTMIERDDHIPPVSEMVDELNRARELHAIALGQRQVAA
jgi:uncharacterized protein (UPF0276 family)